MTAAAFQSRAGSVGAPIDATHVAGVHVDDRGGRRLVAERADPRQAARGSSGGVDDEVAVDHVAIGQPDAGDALPGRVGDQPLGCRLVPDDDVGQRLDPAANGPFEQRPGHRRSPHGRRRAPLASARLVPVEVTADVDVDRAAGSELVDDAREPGLQQPRSRGEQEVRVAALRDLPARLGRVRQLVAVDHDHGFGSGRPARERRTTRPCSRRRRPLHLAAARARWLVALTSSSPTVVSSC